MRLTVTTNWADDFIEKISGFEEVSWIRGRLYKDEVGGQLSYRNFANIPTRKTVEKNIKKIHSIGKEFSYIIDGHCLENKEYSWEGQERIRELIKWISDSGADSVTVAIPHLVEVIKGQFPSLKIDFGTHRSLAEMQRLKYFDKLGCDTIAVRSDYNRNFALLKLFKKSVKCKLKLTLNSLCLYYCNFANDHENLLSHTSNFTTKSKFSRYYNFVCDFERMKSPEEVIKSPFIRPEDVAVYESLGFEDFILEPNSALTEDTLCMINAYTSSKYEGNLLEIMSVMGEKPFSDGKGRIDKRAPRLESKKLKTFLKHFLRGDGNHCLASICGVDCQYCKKWSGVICSDTKNNSNILKRQISDKINKIEDGIYV